MLVGIVLSYTSYGLYKLGGLPELYPFFHWRLYSAPVGAELGGTYRFYTRGAPGEPWERLPIRATSAYSPKDYGWQFGSLVSRTLSDSLGRTDAAERLAIFAHHVAPDAAEVRVVAETLYPQALLQGVADYDTTTVLQLRPRAAQ